MGNAHSSEDLGSAYRRRLSEHQTTSNWVHIAGENDYGGVPTTPLSGAYHAQDDAIPTVANSALLQSQSLSSIQWTKNSSSLGHDLSAPAGCYKSRPSRHSTDVFHPLRSAPVSGSARAASLKENEGLGNDAENKRLDDRYFSSPPALSSSSSTESWRTLSSDSDASRELPHYIPYRRRSLQQIPGLATRPKKSKSNIAARRAKPPTSPAHHSYSLSVQAEADPAPLLSTPAQHGGLDDLSNSTEVGYKQLGSIRFGSLRITNGSPLSMRRGEVNMHEAADLDGDIHDNQTSSGDAANSQHILPPESLATEIQNDSNLTAQLLADSSDALPQEFSNSMHAGETVRGRRGRFSGDGSRTSVETIRARIPSIIDDEQLKLIRRQSTRVTTDDSSSVYSDNFIPVMISEDIVQHKPANNDNSNGPHLSFQSFRSLIRQNRVKSYLQANTKAAFVEKSLHQRTASDQGSAPKATARSPSRSRRKLAKKQPRATSPPASSSSQAEPHTRDAPKPSPLPRRTSKGRSVGEQDKGHASGKSDGQVSQWRLSGREEHPAPRVARRKEHSHRDHPEGYRPYYERVPILLDRTSATPRAHVSFQGDVPNQLNGPIRIEQLRKSQTAEFKPLPTPKPELPQRRKPVKIPEPVPIGFGNRSSHENSMEARIRQDVHPPRSQLQSHTMSQAAQKYGPYQDDDDEPQLFSPNNDSPFVSPLSDEDEDLWPLATRDTSRSTANRPSSSTQAREVSPIRHAVSLPSIRDDPARSLRTPAPISTHSRRALELAERWQEQQQIQQQRQPARASLEQPRLPTFYERDPSQRPTTAGGIDEYDASPFLFVERDTSLPPIVYRNGVRRGSEISTAMWRPPYRVLHSYYSPAYRNAPIWG